MKKSIIPTFSLVELTQGEGINEKFRECLKNTGAFYLTEHGILKSQTKGLVDTAMNFFKTASNHEKLAVTNPIPSIRRGYSELEKESTAQVTNTGLYSDYSMCYSVGLTDNLFPDETFESIFLSYLDSSYSVARRLGQIMLMTAGVTSSQHLEEITKCDPLLRFRYFPDVPENRSSEQEPLRMAPHYDISFFTFIEQTPCENGFVSLHCETDDGFVELPHQEGAIIVLCGAVGTIISEGQIKAPLHHIKAPPKALIKGSGRTSTVMFMRPREDFEFSISVARKCGLDVVVEGDTATFGEWIGANYVNMRNDAMIEHAHR